MQLPYTYLEERRVNGICENLKKDTEYLKFKQIETECYKFYKLTGSFGKLCICHGQKISCRVVCIGCFRFKIYPLCLNKLCNPVFHIIGIRGFDTKGICTFRYSSGCIVRHLRRHNKSDAEPIMKMKLAQYFMNKGYYFQKTHLDKDSELMVSNRQYDTETQFQWTDIEKNIT